MTKQLPYPYTQDQLIAFLKAINCNPYPVPLPPEKLASLRFAKYREFNGETVALPNVLQQILLIDQDFTLAYERNQILYPLFDCLDHDTGVFHSVDLGDVMTEHLRYSKGRDLDFKWISYDTAPCILPLNHVGEQQLYFYVADPIHADTVKSQSTPLQNEYPICRLDPHDFSLWISEISLVHYMGQMANCNMSAFDAHLAACIDGVKHLIDQEEFEGIWVGGT